MQIFVWKSRRVRDASNFKLRRFGGKNDGREQTSLEKSSEIPADGG